MRSDKDTDIDQQWTASCTSESFRRHFSGRFDDAGDRSQEVGLKIEESDGKISHLFCVLVGAER